MKRNQWAFWFCIVILCSISFGNLLVEHHEALEENRVLKEKNEALKSSLQRWELYLGEENETKEL